MSTDRRVRDTSGHQLDDENEDIREVYRRTLPEACERSLKRHFVLTRPNFKIEPRRVTLYFQGETATDTIWIFQY
jgi:hypothetical protein